MEMNSVYIKHKAQSYKSKCWYSITFKTITECLINIFKDIPNLDHDRDVCMLNIYIYMCVYIPKWHDYILTLHHNTITAIVFLEITK